MNVWCASRHAVERYVDRVKPALGFAEAEAELVRLVSMAEVVVDPPGWVLDPSDDSVADGYVVLAGTICLPVRGFTVLTVITPGCMSDEFRAARREHKRAQRARRHALRRLKRQRLDRGDWQEDAA